MFMPRLTSTTRQYQPLKVLVVWDTQTGTVILRRDDINSTGEMWFHGDQQKITVIEKDLYTYDVLNSVQPYQVNIPLQYYQLGAHWTYKDTLRFSTSSHNNGETVINIFEFQPASTSVHVISSLSIPSRFGSFSFSPASSHASFVTEKDIVILDIQNSKLLLQVQRPKKLYATQGYFSPDGHFFACSKLEHEIFIWQNTPTGYIPWTSLRPRLPFYLLEWSPTSISIMCRGKGRIQVLHLENHPTSLSSNDAKPNPQNQKHLVAYSADKAYVATAQQSSGVITIIDCVLGTPLQSIKTNMRIRDIKIVGNTIFVMDTRKLVRWDFEGGRVVHGASDAGGITVNKALTIDAHIKRLALSHDCSQVAFAKGKNLFLYDMKTQKTFTRDMDNTIISVQFSADGDQLWYVGAHKTYYFMGLEMVEDWSSTEVIKGDSKDGQLLFNRVSPYGYHIGERSQWVKDHRGKKLLWLPPNWRINGWKEFRWDGNFLALLHEHHKEPIVIEFPLPATI